MNDGHVDNDNADANRNCPMSESVQRCAQIGMMLEECNSKCRTSASVKLVTNIDITSKTETNMRSESVQLCAQIDMMTIIKMQLQAAESHNLKAVCTDRHDDDHSDAIAKLPNVRICEAVYGY